MMHDAMPRDPRRLRLVQLDVFAARPLEGNPLAVFLDGRGLSDAEMQALAREMNLSETTFVLPRDPATERERGVRVRIFTVQQELPFAGHPTLGTAFALRAERGGEEVALELGVGRVPVRFETGDDGRVFGEMTQVDPSFGALHDPGEVARAVGIDPADLDPALPTQTVSTGLPFTIVPLRSLAAARAMTLDLRRADEYLARAESRHFYFVTRETVDPACRLHARMIFYGGEDPATGSAAGCAAAWMVAHGVAASEERVVIEQGLEANRPSQLHVRAARVRDAVGDVRVGGRAIQVMAGEVVL
jgi:trans-2,3-dihydro-3-hydroxyanthranilate isomerase